MTEGRIDRRGLVAASAGALVLGFAGPLAAAAQSATPRPAKRTRSPIRSQIRKRTRDASGGRRFHALFRQERDARRSARGTVRRGDGNRPSMPATAAPASWRRPSSKRARTRRPVCFFAQDAGALGLLADEGRFQALPAELLDRVDQRFRDPEGRWVGVTGRARVLAYNTEISPTEDLPASVRDLTDPAGPAGLAGRRRMRRFRRSSPRFA